MIPPCPQVPPHLSQPAASAPHVYTAIAHVIAAMATVGISKSRTNDQQGFAFRGIDDVYNSLAAKLVAAQLCVIPRVVARTVIERTTANGSALFAVVVDVEFDLVSALDGSKHTARVCGEAMDTGDKATNKALSAAYKYLALQTFCIPTRGDNDADATTHSNILPTTTAASASAPASFDLGSAPASRAQLGSAAVARTPKRAPLDVVLARAGLASSEQLREIHDGAAGNFAGDDLVKLLAAVAMRAAQLGVELNAPVAIAKAA